MLWLVFAIITLLIVGILLYPLLKGATRDAPLRVDFDIVVYRSQLAELDQEIASGLLTGEQAEAARSEIHRRMLAAEDAEAGDPAGRQRLDSQRVRIAAIIAIAVILPVGAALTYGALGSPRLPGEAYAERQKTDPDLVAVTSADKLAREMQESPSVAGYRRLANMYFSTRNYEQAAAAGRRAIDLGANDAASWSELGEAIVMASGGAVEPEALIAFTNAIGTDPHDDRARFYIGLAESQIGNLRQAVAIWRDLEKDSDPNASWLSMVRDHIAAFAKQGGFDPASVPPSPPSVDALRTAIAGMTGALQSKAGAGGSMAAPPPPEPTTAAAADPQDTMIKGMVAKLAGEMQAKPGDVAGWERLAHAYNVLGEPDKAREAIGRAVRLQPDNTQVLLTLAETQKAAAAPGNDAPADFVITMRRILALDPANASALYYVGLSEEKLGHPEVARVMWDKALTITPPNDPLAIAVRNRLDILSGKTK